jgi:Ricin-type beta-trefoil lectin domain-like
MRMRALAGLAVLVTSLVLSASGGVAQAGSRPPIHPMSGPGNLDNANISNIGPNLNFDPFHVLDVAGWSTANRGRLHMWDYRTTGNVANQRWRTRNIAGSWYQIINVNSGLCLDKSMDSGDHDGAVVYQYACNANHPPNQVWSIHSGGINGHWLIQDAEDSRCLDIQNKNPNIDSNLQVWSCSGAWNQTWSVTPDV